MRLVFGIAMGGSLAAFAQPASAELIYGLLNNDGANGQQLVTFDSVTRQASTPVQLGISSPAASLSSIDVRPATGELFGFSNAAKQLYTINPTTGALTTVGGSLGLPTGFISGAIDFNPTVDRIRLIGTQGDANSGNQNYRLNPANGAIAATDGNLAYAPGDSGAGQIPVIAANAYINNVVGATTTLLYNVDSARDVLVTQNPPNNGTLQTVGALGIDIGGPGLGFGSFTGLDVSGATGTLYLSSSPAGPPAFLGGPAATTSSLYTVDVGSGTAIFRGTVAGLPFGRSIQDIAVTPEPSSLALLALAGVGAMRRRRRA